MPIVEFCQTDVAVVERNSSIMSAARKMRELHVGDVVICEQQNGVSKPIGILTDRDIVVGLLALGISHETAKVEDIMTPALVAVHRDAGFNETIHLMETYGVRRLPVVDDNGGLVGVVSAVDLMEVLGQEILALSRLPSKQRRKEQETRL